MQLTIHYLETDPFLVDIESSETIESLKAIIEVQTGIPIDEQRLGWHDLTLNEDDRQLSAYDFGNQDLIILERTNSSHEDIRIDDIDLTIKSKDANLHPSPIHLSSNQILKPNASLCQEIQVQTKCPNQTLSNSSPNGLDPQITKLSQRIRLALMAPSSPSLRATNSSQLSTLAIQLDQSQPLTPGEFGTVSREGLLNVNVQKAIEKRIQLEAIHAQLERTIEFNPECFGNITMLYVPLELNENPIFAFIDSGAQLTVISHRCAEKCNIQRFIDSRMASMVRGIGSSRSLGRIHSVMIKFGCAHFEASVVVIEQNYPEFIFGLDLLRRYQCHIDLQENVLRVGGESVPFLAEGELPAELRDPSRLESELDPSNRKNPSPSVCPSDQLDLSHPKSPTKTNPTPEIQSLIDLGYSQETVERVLEMCNGNLDLAANYLLQL